MVISRLDHLVLTVGDLEATCRFYETVLGLEIQRFGQDRLAIRVGDQKINLHQDGREREPRADHPTPGSGDLCVITAADLTDCVTHLALHGARVEHGPVAR